MSGTSSMLVHQSNLSGDLTDLRKDFLNKNNNNNNKNKKKKVNPSISVEDEDTNTPPLPTPKIKKLKIIGATKPPLPNEISDVNAEINDTLEPSYSELKLVDGNPKWGQNISKSNSTSNVHDFDDNDENKLLQKHNSFHSKTINMSKGGFSSTKPASPIPLHNEMSQQTGIFSCQSVSYSTANSNTQTDLKNNNNYQKWGNAYVHQNNKVNPNKNNNNNNSNSNNNNINKK